MEIPELEMNKDILKYILEEKDIARYKISLLSKGSKKQYKTRLIAIEEDLIDYPFEKILASSVEEMRQAVSVFRADRHLFYEQFERQGAKKKVALTSFHLENIDSRLSFFKSWSKKLLNEELKKINIIENAYIRGVANIGQEDVVSYGLDSLLEREGALASKARARIQIIIYCIARFIYHKTKSFEAGANSISTIDEYQEALSSLNDFLGDIKQTYLKYYNDAINEVPLLVNGTLGHNNFIHTIYPLSNVIEKYKGHYKLCRLLPKDKTFFTAAGKPIRKKFVERGFGIVTPVNRIGNEAIRLLYADIWSESGIRLTPIFENQFFNSSSSGSYYKAIPTKPIWEWNRLSDNPYIIRELQSMLGIDDLMLPVGLDISDKDVYRKINLVVDRHINVDPDISKIMVSSTRSEDSHISKAIEYGDRMITFILDEYSATFGAA